MTPDEAYAFVQEGCPDDATDEYKAGWKEAAIAFHRALSHAHDSDA